MPTRCCCPPDSSCGYLHQHVLAAARPWQASRVTRSRPLGERSGRNADTAEDRPAAPRVITGFSAADGFWNTMPTYRPRRSATRCRPMRRSICVPPNHDRCRVTCAVCAAAGPSWPWRSSICRNRTSRPGRRVRRRRCPRSTPSHDGLAVDGDVQITNRQRSCAPPSTRDWSTGRAASRSASPNRFNATTTIVTTSPGHSTVSG